MRRWDDLNLETEGTGISEPLSRQANLVGSMLGQITEEQSGTALFEHVGGLRAPCKAAEQQEIIRINCERAETPGRLYSQVAFLLGTDEVQTERPTVREEVAQGHCFLHGSIEALREAIFLSINGVAAAMQSTG